MKNGARSSSIGEEEPGAVDAVCTMTRWSEGAGEKQASVLAGALGAVRQAASLAELSAGSQFARLTKARAMSSCMRFISVLLFL